MQPPRLGAPARRLDVVLVDLERLHPRLNRSPGCLA